MKTKEVLKWIILDAYQFEFPKNGETSFDYATRCEQKGMPNSIAYEIRKFSIDRGNLRFQNGWRLTENHGEEVRAAYAKLLPHLAHETVAA